MRHHEDSELFVEVVREIADAVEPFLKTVKKGNNLCTVQYPGLGEQVWVKVVMGGDVPRFHIFKNRLTDPNPHHLNQITPESKEFLIRVLREYLLEIGHPNVV